MQLFLSEERVHMGTETDWRNSRSKDPLKTVEQTNCIRSPKVLITQKKLGMAENLKKEKPYILVLSLFTLYDPYMDA